MKHTYIAFEMEDGKFVPHDHPVFAGEVAYDLPDGDQEIQVDSDLDVREFNGIGEAMTALTDYFREHPKDDQVALTDFFLVERFSGNPVITAPMKKGKSKKAVTVKPEKVVKKTKNGK